MGFNEFGLGKCITFLVCNYDLCWFIVDRDQCGVRVRYDIDKVQFSLVYVSKIMLGKVLYRGVEEGLRCEKRQVAGWTFFDDNFDVSGFNWC